MENSSTFHLRLRHERGNWVRVEAIATCMGKEADATRIIINARDISERERLEATLHESQKVEIVGRVADHGQIEQVVMNLIVNARDAVIGDGTIDVELDALTLTTNSQPCVPPGRYVTITVRDSGAGISDFARAHLFEPFFTIKALGEGTGLGLATSHGLVKQAGGFIQVDRALSVGSSFRIFLPLADATLETSPKVFDGIPQARNERLLLVEDDPEVRVLMAGIVRRVGYHVTEAANGIEALAILDRGERVDVVVSDVVMPRMGGVELSRAIRQRHADLGIVLVSGYPGDTDFVRSLPERASFLQKPFQSAELAAYVRRALPVVSRQL